MFGNSPRSTTVLSLELRRSFAFGLRFLRQKTGHPLNLTGCTVRLSVRKPKRKGGAVVISQLADILDPALGLTQIRLQGDDLTFEPGEYPFSIVLNGATGYSTTVVKGVIVFSDNADPDLGDGFPIINPATNLAAWVESGDVINVRVDNVDGLSTKFNDIVVAFQNQVSGFLAQLEGKRSETENLRDQVVSYHSSVGALATSAETFKNAAATSASAAAGSSTSASGSASAASGSATTAGTAATAAAGSAAAAAASAAAVVYDSGWRDITKVLKPDSLDSGLVIVRRVGNLVEALVNQGQQDFSKIRDMTTNLTGTAPWPVGFRPGQVKVNGSMMTVREYVTLVDFNGQAVADGANCVVRSVGTFSANSPDPFASHAGIVKFFTNDAIPGSPVGVSANV